MDNIFTFHIGDNLLDFIIRFFAFMAPFFIFTYGSMIFFMVHVFQNKGFADKQKMFWALMLFFLNIISFPVYWYLYILKEGQKSPKEKTAVQQFLVTVLFFIPLGLFLFVIMLGIVFAVRNEKLSQPVIMIWAVFFDCTFFPILIYLIVKTAKNKNFSAGKKTKWILLLLFFHMFVFPVYRIKYLAKK